MSKRISEGVEELSPGLYRLRGEYQDPTTIDPRTGRPRVKEIDRRFKGSKLEAIKRREELLEAAKRGAVRPEKHTFGSYSTLWFKVRRAGLGELAAHNYFQFLKHHILPKWEDRVLDTITSDQVEAWLAELRMTEVLGRRHKENGVWKDPKPIPGKYLRPASINSIYAIFRMVMARAAGNLGIPNPCIDVHRIPKKKKKNRVEEANSLVIVDDDGEAPDDLLVRFIGVVATTEPDYYAEILLALAIGARFCELRPLRWFVDYNEATRKLTLQRSQRGKSLNDELKNGEDRPYRVPPRLAEVLKWHRERQMASGVPNPMGLMFPPKNNSGRGFQGASTLNGVFKRLNARIALPCVLTPKGARRTNITVLQAKGLDGNLVERMAGHADAAMRQIYTEFPLSSTERAVTMAVGNAIVIPMPPRREEAPHGERPGDRGDGVVAGVGQRVPTETAK